MTGHCDSMGAVCNLEVGYRQPNRGGGGIRIRAETYIEQDAEQTDGNFDDPSTCKAVRTAGERQVES
jgi:hypothetical protein